MNTHMFFKPALLCAFVALLPACNLKDSVREPEQRFSVSIVGERENPDVVPATRAYIYGYEGAYYCSWEDGDRMNLYVDAVTAPGNVLVNTGVTDKCNFSGTVSASQGSHALYGFYPSSALVAGSESEAGYSVKLKIPASQTPMWGCSDGAADILLMKPATLNSDGLDKVISGVRFARVGAVAKVVPVDDTGRDLLKGENIIKLTIRTQSTALAGTAEVNVKDMCVNSWTDPVNEVSANYSKEDFFQVNDDNALFFVLKPSVIPAGEQVTFVLETEHYIATKKVVSDDVIEFREGKVSVLGLFFVNDEVEEKEGGYGDEREKVSNYPKWAELPLVKDADSDGIDDTNAKLYYSVHRFTMNNKKWRNYTVCYDSGHICPLWVAAPRHSVYENKNTDRSDAYAADPGIPASVQYKSKDTGGGCNKGHMLGSAERLCCAEANRQVFYYSNIAPQHSSGYNTGGGGWNILEDWVDSKMVADTLYEVVGCYFEKYTDGYNYTVNPSTTSFGGRSNVSIPTMFYYVLLRTKKGNTGKSVFDCSASELQCAAFVRSHTNSLKGQKVTAKEMMSVADLEKITGITYFPNVPNAPKNVASASDWGL